MPRVTWTIDGDDTPLRRKLSQIDRLADKTGSKLENLDTGKKTGGLAPGGLGTGSGGGGGPLGGLGLSRAVPIAAIGTAAVAAVGGLAKLGGELETTRIQFATFLGSVEAGNALLNKLTQFANFTPFSNDEINRSAKTLLSFGLEADQVTSTLKTLGDISAGTGKPIAELSVIFGQIRSTGRLMGQDLLQLINAGFNPLQVISEKTGRSMLNLKKDMEQGKISFADVEDAMKTATSEGGLFFDLTTKLSNSFEGKLSTALGKGRFILQTIGEKILPVVNFFLDRFIGLIDEASKVNLDPIVDPFRELWGIVRELTGPFDDLFAQISSGLSEGLEGFSALQAVVDVVGVAIRGATLPLRGFLKLLSLTIQGAEGIKKAFQGVGDIIGGTFRFDFDQIRRGFLEATTQGTQVVADIAQGLKDFIKDDAARGFNVLSQIGRTDKAPLPGEGAAGTLAAVGGGADLQRTGAAADTPRQPTTTRSASRSSISGGQKLTNFTINEININITFDRSQEFSEEELQLAVQRSLSNAVNNFQRQAGQ